VWSDDAAVDHVAQLPPCEEIDLLTLKL
jgi:hypothetical protein